MKINKLRMAYIEALIVTQNKVNTNDIINMFGIKRCAASRDFRYYKELYPDNIQYCIVTRCYKASITFKSQALEDTAAEFLVNLLALEDYLK